MCKRVCNFLGQVRFNELVKIHGGRTFGFNSRVKTVPNWPKCTFFNNFLIYVMLIFGVLKYNTSKIGTLTGWDFRFV